MDCVNLKEFNQFQVRRISAYLKQNDELSYKEKQGLAERYIRENSEDMRQEFCSKCHMCSLKRREYASLQTVALSTAEA